MSKLVIFTEEDWHSLMLTYFVKTEDLLGGLEYQFCEVEGESYVAVDPAAFRAFMVQATQAGYPPQTEVELRTWSIVDSCPD